MLIRPSSLRLRPGYSFARVVSGSDLAARSHEQSPPPKKVTSGAAPRGGLSAAHLLPRRHLELFPCRAVLAGHARCQEGWAPALLLTPQAAQWTPSCPTQESHSAPKRPVSTTLTPPTRNRSTEQTCYSAKLLRNMPPGTKLLGDESRELRLLLGINHSGRPTQSTPTPLQSTAVHHDRTHALVT